MRALPEDTEAKTELEPLLAGLAQGEAPGSPTILEPSLGTCIFRSIPAGVDADAIFFADTQVDAVDDALFYTKDGLLVQSGAEELANDNFVAAAESPGAGERVTELTLPVSEPSKDLRHKSIEAPGEALILTPGSDANLEELVDEQISGLLRNGSQDGRKLKIAPGALVTQEDATRALAVQMTRTSPQPVDSSPEQLAGLEAKEQRTTSSFAENVSSPGCEVSKAREVEGQAEVDQARTASLSMKTMLDAPSTLLSPSEQSPEEGAGVAVVAASPQQPAKRQEIASFSDLLNMPNQFTMEADWADTALSVGGSDFEKDVEEKCSRAGSVPRSPADCGSGSPPLHDPPMDQAQQSQHCHAVAALVSQHSGDTAEPMFDTCDLHFDSQMSQVAGADANGYCGRFALKALLAQKASFKPGCSHKRVRLY